MKESGNYCPRCGIQSNRLVTDSCGHTKCRSCFLDDESSCLECKVQQEQQQRELLGTISQHGQKVEEVVVVQQHSTTNLIKKPQTSSNNSTIIPNHMQQSRNADGKLQYHCSICQKSFSRSQKYYHMGCDNVDSKKYKCEQCQKCFSSRSHYNYHREKHNSQLYRCNQCQKAFSNRFVMQKHEKLHQAEPKSCEECGKSFRCKQALVAHVEQQHRNILRFQCNMCDKRYALKSTLQQHKLSHMQKQHTCPQCNQCFQRNSSLRLHLKRHSKADSFVCATCNKNFKDLNTLLRHAKIHTGGLKYKCRYCETITVRKDTMLRHVRNMHVGEEFDKCVELISLEKTENTAIVPTFMQMTNTTEIQGDDCNENPQNQQMYLNFPKTVENSSVIKCIGNVEPVRIPSATEYEEPVSLTTLNTVSLEQCNGETAAMLAHVKPKKKYDPVEQYNKILNFDEDYESPNIHQYEDEEQVNAAQPMQNNYSSINIQLKKSEQVVEKPLETQRPASITHWRKNFKYTYEYQEY